MGGISEAGAMSASLVDKLQSLIAANGPMSVSEYMAHCLGDPEHGYYATRDPFGAAGDFITAPEVSQMFGEIVGAWLIEAWQRAGAPDPVRLVELGPGRGTLMADIVRVAAYVPDFLQAASIHLVETSPALARRQAETLAARDVEANWHTSFDAVPTGPLLVVANEFFDALPIRQYVRLDVWRERVVGIDGRGRLTFGIGPGVFDSGFEARQGSILEVRPAGEALMAAIAGRIASDGIAALVVDYGYVESGPGETLQAVRGHGYRDPFDRPGESDLTAHVDFAALARSARSEGAAVHGPMEQGAFLLALGLAERAGKLGAEADEETRQAISAAVERLAGREQMGTLFKALAVTPRGVVPPPFRS
jgi:NADH dehydrogenase [ubiquinone] 1 alpha subcomplex assembly factor 7